MGRLFLFAALFALILVIGYVLLTIMARILGAGQNMLRSPYGLNKEGQMVPTPYQKITYAALIVLLFGVATGWLGGL
jgi:cell division protein FtsX